MKSQLFKYQDAELVYYPDFLKPEEANSLYDSLYRAISWQQKNIKIFGKNIPQPRLTTFFAEKGVSYTYSGLQWQPESFPSEIKKLMKKLEAVSRVKFNTCLANLYRDGQDSMGWHADDEKVLGKNPVIASLSLGGKRRFRWKHKTQKSLKDELILNHGSLLLMQGGMQHHWKHQLPKTKIKVSPRINLTFRKVYNM
ncbi:Alkylated DNA repair dioxygenase AlkB [Salegentibacter echinorum]|uniref:Alkylated DNA repair dioxygenase AlkB n=1 Tax=Salegentibacter echinorum TaxID=1073325 RepID=A0A1M5GSF2_SALEC|nr:alpha-ketoglutarate-dependent dioxygenase AlkB [Salegentibacter echinorum]SHG06649.1 Alkylated DNA repair dioxygenase AlkB [Salegentibacter echinorum]